MGRTQEHGICTPPPHLGPVLVEGHVVPHLRALERVGADLAVRRRLAAVQPLQGKVGAAAKSGVRQEDYAKSASKLF